MPSHVKTQLTLCKGSKVLSLCQSTPRSYRSDKLEWGWSNLRGTLASTDRSCAPTRVLSLNLQEGRRFLTGRIRKESE